MNRVCYEILESDSIVNCLKARTGNGMNRECEQKSLSFCFAKNGEFRKCINFLISITRK